MDDLRVYYGILNEAKAYIKQLPIRKQPSENTIKQYASVMRRMSKQGLTPIDASCKKSFYAYRAAWCFVYEYKVKEFVSKAQKEQDNVKKVMLIKKLDYYVQALRQYPPDTLKSNVKQIDYISQWQKAEKPKQKSNSKKYQKLPCDWQNRYFDYMKSIDSKYLNAVAVLSLSGCRPFELQKGIKLIKEENGIRFVIESAKTHEGQFGQKTRSFLVSSDSGEYKHLLTQFDTEITIKVDSSKNLGDWMRICSKDCFGSRMKSYISPYTYRHNFSSLIKSALDDDSVAVAMGHSNDLSQAFYRPAKRSSGGFSIDEVQGTRAVKHVAKHNLDQIVDQSMSLRM